MKLTLDVENTVTKVDNKYSLDPYEPNNSLVMVGMLADTGAKRIITFDHSERKPTENGFQTVQDWLDNTTVLIAHNIVHDLTWLWETGFKYDGAVFDTMLGEYVLQRGQKEPISLAACAERYQLHTQKGDTMKEYLSKGVSVRDIPYDELALYLTSDLEATQQLAERLWERLNSTDAGLLNTVTLTNEVAKCLARIKKRGFAVDLAALDEVEQQFVQEQIDLEKALTKQVKQLMGDQPINLNSTEQMSQIIYGRKPNDKKQWAELVDDYMSNKAFNEIVNTHSSIVYRKRAEQCTKCNGSGQVRKVKKDGSPFKNTNKCPTCDGAGYLLHDTDTRAGLKFRPANAKWMKADGFATGKDTLEFLIGISRAKGMTEAEDFLTKLRRLNAVSSYLSNFVGGIRNGWRPDGMLHVQLTQSVTSTGRFSGKQPNMQNMPRGSTFPIKKAFVSRWPNGQVMEADFAQLEFRVAGFLSQDELIYQEIVDGFDVHSYTAQVITNAGEPTGRQDAKPHTFAPLYGATGYGRTPAVKAYYEGFIHKYRGVAKWHGSLADEAVRTGIVKLPTGREFAFPNVTRRANGGVTHFTNIKNYPVQSFATADIVPAVMLEIDKRLEPYNSCLVNSVHDSVVIDVHPDETQQVIDVMKGINRDLHDIILLRLGVDFNLPLLLEAKLGPNWLEQKEVDYSE